VNALVIDIGGSHVKMLAAGQNKPRHFDSHEKLSPAELVSRVKDLTADWKYDVVSIGVPGRVNIDGPAVEPPNLGTGWIRYDFGQAFGRPVRVVNDAAMQALGGYGGGRMLFLGLGTGLGSALVVDRVVIPLELGTLKSGDGQLFDRLGKQALERDGKKVWMKAVFDITQNLAEAFVVDYIVLGGGNAAIVDPLPPKARMGGNEDAFTGRFRLWEEPVELHNPQPARVWRVVC
jgi:polyphosphate glucokinase